MTKRIIEEDELLQLLEHDAILSALESGGVDNWDWYEDSMEDLEFPDDESLAKYPVYHEESSDEAEPSP